MRSKKLLATILLGIGFCLVSIPGYGEVKKYQNITTFFLRARINYIMTNPTSFLDVDFDYDPDGRYKKLFPEGINTKDKIYIEVRDNRGVFSYKSGATKYFANLLKKQLEAAYSFISILATDMDNDIVARFYNVKNVLIGSFYQGKYYFTFFGIYTPLS